MKTSRVMAMNHERVVLTSEDFRAGLGRLVESALASVVRQGLIIIRRVFRRFRLRGLGWLLWLLCVKSGRVSPDRLPRVAFFKQYVCGVSQVEFVRVSDRSKAVPRQRHRHRSVCAATNAVRRNDCLISVIAVDVDQPSALALVFLDQKRGRLAVSFYVALGDVERGFSALLERPLRFDGSDDVHAFAD